MAFTEVIIRGGRKSTLIKNKWLVVYMLETATRAA